MQQTDSNVAPPTQPPIPGGAGAISRGKPRHWVLEVLLYCAALFAIFIISNMMVISLPRSDLRSRPSENELDPPEPTAFVNAEGVELQSPEPKLIIATTWDKTITLEFEIVNPNDEPVSVFAYGRLLKTIAPLYRLEFQRSSKWKEVFVGWCGTGAGPVNLPSREPVKFTVQLYPELVPTDWDAVRVGISCRSPSTPREQKPFFAWSRAISRQEATSGPSGSTEPVKK